MPLIWKKDYRQLKGFLFGSLVSGLILALLHSQGLFSKFDFLLLGDVVTTPVGVQTTLFFALIIIFHSVFPGIFILEEGLVKGLAYTGSLWFFYAVLLHSYATSYSLALPMAACFLAGTITLLGAASLKYRSLAQEKDNIRQAFGSFIEPRVADMLLDDPTVLTADGVRRRVTIMFADMRGFTRLCEFVPPEELIAMLRDCFSTHIHIIKKHEGSIDKLIGDSIMAVWGSHHEVEHHEEKAVRAALEMQEAMIALGRKWEKRLGTEIRLGIGINTDEVIVGTVGSLEFFDYTVLGNGVNLASRLESVCPGGMVYVSAETAKSVEKVFEVLDLDSLRVHHDGSLVRAFLVLSAGSPQLHGMLPATMRMQPA